ncbi:DUF6311 domain-containing protein [uncultured Gemmiger sp.]|uniref:DUF6311 domain-containing protein n=1 Tax=uncultured Gemmiger sp. TaxID=1623490 RepID=UPI0025F3BAE8|nr:DUF6311 domain-containing protein [uncultured Gemmiger sp.]
MEQATSRRRTYLLFGLGGLLGVLAFLLVYGITPLNPAEDAFCRGGYIEKDIQQHYAGWLFYRQSDLTLPFCLTQSINYPDGLSVAYTDSVPLFAALFRLLSPLLPGTFQYFGIFTLLAFCLQGAFGALLAGLFARGTIVPLLGDILFVSSPILYERAFRHTALGAQFVLLAALYWYFLCRRQGRMPGAGLFVLNVLVITIHPYFLPMTYAVTLALLAEYAVAHHQWKKPLLWLGADLASTLAAGWLFGLFSSRASGGSDALYGYFGLNLNALWNPVGVGGTVWSRVLPVQNQVGGNYDAFAYLGLGVLLALPVAALALTIQRRLDLRGLLRRHWMLIIVCLILSVFAVSNVITANGATLIHLPLPGWLLQLCSVFRSSGRMFWPVYDLITLAAFVWLLRAVPKQQRWLPMVIAAVLAAVQVWDISPGLVQRRDAMIQANQSDAFPTQLSSNFWQAAAKNYRHIVSMDGIQDDALHLALYAADHNMTTNDPFAARYDAGVLSQVRRQTLTELDAGRLQEDSLYLFHDEGLFLQHVESIKELAWCGEVTAADGSRWYVIAPGMEEFSGDGLCTRYGDGYPLRLADYTDGLWNRGVLDSDKKTVCFADAPFTRAKLEQATAICANGQTYPITKFDDSDPGWLMITLDIDDATVLWGVELETIQK